MSPDAKLVRVTRMVKPFSYDVPVSNFGSIEEVWDTADGKALAKLIDRPINLGVQDDTPPPADPRPRPAADAAARTRTGKREIAWRADGQGLTLPRAGAAARRVRERRRDVAAAAAARVVARAGRSGANQEGGRTAAARSARIGSISGSRRSTTRARR